MRLKELRKAKGITVHIWKKSSVSLREVSLWEKEELGNASFKNVVKLVEVLELNLEELVSEK